MKPYRKSYTGTPALNEELDKINPQSARECFTHKSWEQYRQKEIKRITPFLEQRGYRLDEQQVHAGGERYLMSGAKLVLLGIRLGDGQRVVIKASSTTTGRAEITHEYQTITALNNLPFAYQTVKGPAILEYQQTNTSTVLVSKYIPQPHPITSLPLTEQFRVVINSLHEHEAIHATTGGHIKQIKKNFGLASVHDYLYVTKQLEKWSLDYLPHHQTLRSVLKQASFFVHKHSGEIDLYCDFLTHCDFAPMNMRFYEGNIYTIDQTSFHFGNKYEGWARLVNYMVLYNPPLAEMLNEYVRINTIQEEYASFRSMRVYKLMYLITYYASSATKAEDNLKSLSHERINFWIEVLHQVLNDQPINTTQVEQYKIKRDGLRSQSELERQRALQQI